MHIGVFYIIPASELGNFRCMLCFVITCRRECRAKNGVPQILASFANPQGRISLLASSSVRVLIDVNRSSPRGVNTVVDCEI
jgi:hypothetical protein